MRKNTRGRTSKVDLLPDDIRAQLSLMLRDKSHTQEEVREFINGLIRDAGLDDEYQLSRSGINRYASRMEEVGAKIRASREVAKIWTQQLGEAPESDIGKLLLEFVKTMAFETSMSMSETGEPVSPKVLGQLAYVVGEIERAHSVNYKREQAIREDVIKAAAKAVEKAGKEAGVGIDNVAQMVKAVYGIN
ncbi:DUF3486 family protein [Oligella urethralis]|uniref:DUF3486 family protein n=1 Tax=Oligella urethralis TaxID=90245 RepID=UPI00288A9C78|nr:DUF3486 family protein [Oligella urethralis]